MVFSLLKIGLFSSLHSCSLMEDITKNRKQNSVLRLRKIAESHVLLHLRLL